MGPGTTRPQVRAVFVEAMAARQCLHSPAVVASGKVGQSIGGNGATIDPFGDAIMCCKELVGDLWRHRHDSVKLAIGRECLTFKLPHDIKVYGLFAYLVKLCSLTACPPNPMC